MKPLLSFTNTESFDSHPPSTDNLDDPNNIDSEDKILQRYSTPGLRKNELDRSAKKDQLAGQRLTPDEIHIILDKIYGPEIKETVDKIYGSGESK